MPKAYVFAISKKAMESVERMLALEHGTHQQFDGERLEEGGVSVAFREEPEFLMNWTEPFYADDEQSFEKDHGYCGGLIAVVPEGLVFAADPDPLDGQDWETFSPSFRHALIPWANILSVQVKHST
jgi:hypothetical protein